MDRALASMFALACALAAGCRRHPRFVYPVDVVENFMASCMQRSSERVCRCGIDTLQERFTFEQFSGFEAQLSRNETPREMLDALASCRD